MGNIVDLIATYKIEAILVSVVAASGFLLHRENTQNDHLRKMLN